MAEPIHRILIVGSPGSGKSTLAVRLGEALSLPVVHLDRLYWRSGWTSVSGEEFDRLLERELARDRFIIDGNFSRTLSRRMECSDAVILLEYNRITCLLGALRRVAKTYGKTRPDMGEGCPERFDRSFLTYIWTFPERVFPETYEAIAAHPEVRLIHIRSRRECRALLQRARDGGRIDE